VPVPQGKKDPVCDNCSNQTDSIIAAAKTTELEIKY
jgi:hypothetical protein